MGGRETGNKNWRILFLFFFLFVHRSSQAWQPPNVEGVSLGRPDLASRTTGVVAFAFSSPESKEGVRGRDSSFFSDSSPETFKSGESENENESGKVVEEFPNGTDPTNSTLASPISNTAVETKGISRSETDGFTEFAASQTPLLAEVLARKRVGNIVVGDVYDEEDFGEVSIEREMSSELIVVALATCSLVGILGDLLSNYEWVQTLRYFWPLSLGAYYGMLWNQAYDDNDRSLRSVTIQQFGPSAAFSPKKGPDDPGSLLLQLGYVFGGFGLFVGGLADAVLPVWMTGPNWITNAGLAPDCAFLLLALSVGEEYGIVGRKRMAPGTDTEKDRDETEGRKNPRGRKGGENKVAVMAPLLLRITWWAELYKLGESSLDEVICNVQTILSTST